MWCLRHGQGLCLINKKAYFYEIMAFETIDIKDISGLQSIELPDNFKINDDKVYLKKVGNSIFIIPFHNPWKNLVEGVKEFSDDFMDSRNQSEQQIRPSLD